MLLPALARARVPENVPAAAPALRPGQIDERYYLGAGSGVIELLELKPQGGRLMTWPDFVNGRHVQPGDRFEAPATDD